MFILPEWDSGRRKWGPAVGPAGLIAGKTVVALASIEGDFYLLDPAGYSKAGTDAAIAAAIAAYTPPTPPIQPRHIVGVAVAGSPTVDGSYHDIVTSPYVGFNNQELADTGITQLRMRLFMNVASKDRKSVV